MPDLRTQFGPAHRALMTWGRLEALIGTPLAEQAWTEHWETVVALRRRYAGSALAGGAVLGAAAAAGAWLAGQSRQDRPALLLAVAALLVIPIGVGRWWGRARQTTVAPFTHQFQQTGLRLAAGLGFVAVLVLSLVVPPSSWWPVTGAVVAALPLWLSGVRELRRPAPGYPAMWRRFTAATTGR